GLRARAAARRRPRGGRRAVRRRAGQRPVRAVGAGRRAARPGPGGGRDRRLRPALHRQPGGRRARAHGGRGAGDPPVHRRGRPPAGEGRRGAARARPPPRPAAPGLHGRGDQPAGRLVAQADRPGAAAGRAAGPGAGPDRARPEGCRAAGRRLGRPARPLAAGAVRPRDRPPAVRPARFSGDAVVAMDHALVRRLRTEVAEQIAGQRRDDAVLGLAMSPEDERQYARSLIARALASHARLELESGRVPPTAEEEEDLAAAVHAALYGVGRLQPLLDDPMVENVDINGCDRVFVGYADGRELMLDPVAETDEELVELVQTLAAYSGLSSRPFDTANPQLDLRLPDGSRLSAVMEVTKRPVVSIRRARLPKVFLSDLVGNGTLDQGLAAFMRAAVVARKNIMIAGSTNAGKTTMLRALANEIPPHERLITVERALELGLDEFPDLHPNVVAFEERLPNSEGQGRISMAELVRRSLRMNPSRVIVGEVLGDEIVTMLNAMSQGNDGSLSTIHANSSSEVFNRIATYALQAAEHLPIEASHMLIAGAINYVIFVERRNDYRSGGQLRRFV